MKGVKVSGLSKRKERHRNLNILCSHWEKKAIVNTNYILIRPKIIDRKREQHVDID